jgi:hypothetical protein
MLLLVGQQDRVILTLALVAERLRYKRPLVSRHISAYAQLEDGKISPHMWDRVRQLIIFYGGALSNYFSHRFLTSSLYSTLRCLVQLGQKNYGCIRWVLKFERPIQSTLVRFRVFIALSCLSTVSDFDPCLPTVFMSTVNLDEVTDFRPPTVVVTYINGAIQASVYTCSSIRVTFVKDDLKISSGRCRKLIRRTNHYQISATRWQIPWRSSRFVIWYGHEWLLCACTGSVWLRLRGSESLSEWMIEGIYCWPVLYARPLQLKEDMLELEKS